MPADWTGDLRQLVPPHKNTPRHRPRRHRRRWPAALCFCDVHNPNEANIDKEVVGTIECTSLSGTEDLGTDRKRFTSPLRWQGEKHAHLLRRLIGSHCCEPTLTGETCATRALSTVQPSTSRKQHHPPTDLHRESRRDAHMPTCRRRAAAVTRC